MGKIMILDQTGHSTLTYGETAESGSRHLSDEEVAAEFAKIVESNFVYAASVPVMDPKTGEPTGETENRQVKEFDPEVETYIVHRPMSGG